MIEREQKLRETTEPYYVAGPSLTKLAETLIESLWIKGHIQGDITAGRRKEIEPIIVKFLTDEFYAIRFALRKQPLRLRAAIKKRKAA